MIQVNSKVVFKNVDCVWNRFLKIRNFDYFIVKKIMNHSQREGGKGFRVCLPNGEFVVNASESQLIEIVKN